ncbi:hypothetical protein ACHAW6_006116 [Cyclotella cf. meneghiniana]
MMGLLDVMKVHRKNLTAWKGQFQCQEKFADLGSEAVTDDNLCFLDYFILLMVFTHLSHASSHLSQIPTHKWNTVLWQIKQHIGRIMRERLVC